MVVLTDAAKEAQRLARFGGPTLNTVGLGLKLAAGLFSGFDAVDTKSRHRKSDEETTKRQFDTAEKSVAFNQAFQGVFSAEPFEQIKARRRTAMERQETDVFTPVGDFLSGALPFLTGII